MSSTPCQCLRASSSSMSDAHTASQARPGDRHVDLVAPGWTSACITPPTTARIGSTRSGSRSRCSGPESYAPRQTLAPPFRTRCSRKGVKAAPNGEHPKGQEARKPRRPRTVAASWCGVSAPGLPTTLAGSKRPASSGSGNTVRVVMQVNGKEAVCCVAPLFPFFSGPQMSAMFVVVLQQVRPVAGAGQYVPEVS